MPPLKFDRWRNPRPSTWIFSTFKKNLTNINDMYWSFRPVHDWMIRLSKATSGNVSTSVFFSFSGVDERRAAKTLQEWKTGFEDFSNWTLLNGIVSLSAFFELYLSAIADCAMRSKPELIDSTLIGVDGCTFLKTGLSSNNIKPIVGKLTDGRWADRLSAYKKTFGPAPQALVNHTAELDKIRLTRNKVAHLYGLDSGSPHIYPWAMPRKVNIDISKFQAWLGIVEDCCKQIDKDLSGKYIGEYEIVNLYHQWFIDRTSKGKFDRSLRVKLFRKHIVGLSGLTAPESYFHDCVKYFEALK